MLVTCLLESSLSALGNKEIGKNQLDLIFSIGLGLETLVGERFVLQFSLYLFTLEYIKPTMYFKEAVCRLGKQIEKNTGGGGLLALLVKSIPVSTIGHLSVFS